MSPTDSDTLSRDDLLAVDPRALVTGGALRLPLPDELARVGPLALVEQLREDGLRRDALELALVVIARVADEGAAAGAERLTWLRDRLTLQARGYPRFSAWASALGEALLDADSVAAARTLVDRAREIWGLSDAIRFTLPPP